MAASGKNMMDLDEDEEPEVPDHICTIQHANRKIKERGKCKFHPMLTYYRFRICQHHWDRHCNEDDVFDIKAYHEIVDEPKSEEKQIEFTVKWSGPKSNPYKIYVKHEDKTIEILESSPNTQLKFISDSLAHKAKNKVQAILDSPARSYQIIKLKKIFGKTMWVINNDGIDQIINLLK